MIAGIPPLAAVELRRAIDAYIARRGPDGVHPFLLDLQRDLADATRHHSPPPNVALGDTPALVTFTEAAATLGVSRSTVGRLAKRHGLSRVGRRLVAAEIDRLAKGRGAWEQPTTTSSERSEAT
jgi:hypothetical protein